MYRPEARSHLPDRLSLPQSLLFLYNQSGILYHTAAFHDDFCLVGGAHSGHAAKVAQHSILTQRHGAGHSGVGGNDSVLHINRIIPVAVTADSLCEYSTLVS